MNRYIKNITAALIIALTTIASGCSKDDISETGNGEITDPSAPTILRDTGLSMYYGNRNNDGIGIFVIALTNGTCYQEGSQTYLGSEGDLVVLEFRSSLVEDGESIALPEGNYRVSEFAPSKMTINAGNSYVLRQSDRVQSKWEIKSGTVTVKKGNSGRYTLSTKDFVICKGEEYIEREYSFNSFLPIGDYMEKAPEMFGQEDDLTDIPFSDVTCNYYGNLYDSNTGNFTLTLSTLGLKSDKTGNLPGIRITINAFSKLYEDGQIPGPEAGRYNVTSMESFALFSEWTLAPGAYLDLVPFGTYVYQQVKDGDPEFDMISSGYIEISYDEQNICTLKYDFKAGGREVSGSWRGKLSVTR